MIRRIVPLGIGLVLGLALASLLVSWWTAEPFPTGVSAMLGAPRALLVVPVLVALVLGWVTVRVADMEEPVKIAGGFLVGSLLGLIAGAVLFGFARLPDHGLIVHLLSGLVLGGALGSAVPFLSSRLLS